MDIMDQKFWNILPDRIKVYYQLHWKTGTLVGIERWEHNGKVDYIRIYGEDPVVYNS